MVFDVLLCFAAPTAAALTPDEEAASAVVNEHTLTRRDLGDGTFVWDLPLELAMPSDQTIGATTWTYDGQQPIPYPETVEARGPVWNEPDTDTTPLDLESALLSSVRIDGYGRRWVPAKVDLAAAQARVETYREALYKTYEEGGEKLPTDLTPIMDAEEGGWVEFHSWTTKNCGTGICSPWVSAGAVCQKNWDGDDRDILHGRTDPEPGGGYGLTDRQRAVVVLAKNFGTDTVPWHMITCSGVLIDDDVVLTAAHCVEDGDFDEVCTKGVIEYQSDSIVFEDIDCRDVDPEIGSLVHEDYSPLFGTDMEHDLALVFLDTSTSFDSDVAPLALADDVTGSDTVLDGLFVYNVAAPTIVDSEVCDQNNDAYSVDVLEWLAPNKWVWSKQYTRNRAAVFHLTTRKVGTYLDSGPGHSGSPIWFCPAGDDDWCGEGEPALVVSIMSGWSGGIPAYNGGVKVPYYFDWITGELP